MNYGYQPQTQVQQPQFVQPGNQIIKRPITDPECDSLISSYETMQKGLVVIGAACIFILILDLFVGASEPYATPLMIFSILIGIVGIAGGANSTKQRGQIEKAISEGNVIEVRAPGYKSRMSRNLPGIAVGPVSIPWTKEIASTLVEGSIVSVVCIPKIKMAISVNNIPMRRIVRVDCADNIEAMAVPVGMPAQPMPQQPTAPTQNAYPQYGQPATQAQPPQPIYPQFDPPQPPQK